MTNYFNKVEIQGIVGNVFAQSTTEDFKDLRLSVCTQYSYVNEAGGNIIEATWHNVITHLHKNDEVIGKIGKGKWVKVTGRLHHTQYLNNDKSIYTSYEIVASEIEVIEEQEG